MLVPGSRDFGTVNLKLSHNSQHYSVKIYSRIVHVVKSFNSKLQASIPKRLSGVRKQAEAARTMLHKLNVKTVAQLMDSG